MPREPNRPREPARGNRDRRLAAWIFGGLTLLVVIYVVVLGPKELPTYRHQALGFLCAVLSGLFAYFFTGTFAIGGEWKPKAKLSLRAAGGSALFVLVLLWWHSDVAPIKEVREEMRGVRDDVQGFLSQVRSDLGIKYGSIETLLVEISRSGSVKLSAQAVELAQQIPASAGNDALALKAAVLKSAADDRRAGPQRLGSSQGQTAVPSKPRDAAAREVSSASAPHPAAPIPATVPATGGVVYVPGPASPQNGNLDPIVRRLGADEAEELSRLVWRPYHTNNYLLAIKYAQECITKFEVAARLEQEEVTQAGISPHFGESVNAAEARETRSRGSLNLVATCWWLKGDSYLNLSKFWVEGQQPDQDALRKARDAFRATLEYGHGRCWDTNGFFWSPAAAAKDEKLPVIERALSQRVESK
jgi:hypothetical protein